MKLQLTAPGAALRIICCISSVLRTIRQRGESDTPKKPQAKFTPAAAVKRMEGFEDLDYMGHLFGAGFIIIMQGHHPRRCFNQILFAGSSFMAMVNVDVPKT